MAKINGGQLFIKALKRAGVKYVFNLCGGHIDPYYPAMIEEEIGIIDVRHEQVAAHAAAGWARVTGEPGVALVTAGPGVTDSVTGVAESFYAGCPMILVGGCIPLAELDMGSPQDVDHARLMAPITKWTATIHEAKRIPEYVSAAFRIAKSGIPGPVYLQCPIDILMGQQVEENDVVFPENYYAEQESGGSPTQIKKAVALLMGAQRPVVIAGDAVFWAKADGQLREFVELTEIPVQMMPSPGMIRGAVPEDHPLALAPHDFASAATALADVVLMLGGKFDYTLNYGRPPLFSTDAAFIQVGVDGSLIGFNRDVDIGIVASPKTVLEQMIDEIKGAKKRVNHSVWIQELNTLLKTVMEATEQSYGADSLPVHPGRLSREVAEFLDSDAVVIADGGDIAYGWFLPYIKARYMGQVLATGSLGCLGLGTGFAIAAKLAKRDKQVLLFSGDGSFGFNGMDFDTLVRHELPVVCVVANDSAWGMVKHGRGMVFGEDNLDGSLLRQGTRYDKLVEALGGYGEYVDSIDGIKPALARAFASGLPACINVEVDPKPISSATLAYVQLWGLMKA